MTEILNLKDIDIPYGVLHDQKLLSLSQNNNKLVFTFDIKIYENDYSTDFYLKYKDYKHCKMIVDLADEPFNYFSLITAINRKDKFEGLSLSREAIIDCLNNSDSTFIGCTTDRNYFNIELAVSFYNSKKFKKYKKYTLCRLEIDCHKSVVWEWY